MWFVYVLQCHDGSLYTGIALDVAARLAQHQQGTASKYTRSRLPVTVLYTESQPSRSAALKREWAIKQWPRAEKISRLQLPVSE